MNITVDRIYHRIYLNIARAIVSTGLCRHMVSLAHNELTHPPLEKMAAVLQMIFSDPFHMHFRMQIINEKFCILFKILPKFVLKGPIDNKGTLV